MEANNQKPQNDELSEQELDQVSGGIIVIGGKNLSPAQINQNPVSSRINWGSLNPQPLPPRISNSH
jgi:bacteriocin-like protein